MAAEFFLVDEHSTNLKGEKVTVKDILMFSLVKGQIGTATPLELVVRADESHARFYPKELEAFKAKNPDYPIPWEANPQFVVGSAVFERKAVEPEAVVVPPLVVSPVPGATPEVAFELEHEPRVGPFTDSTEPDPVK